LGIDILSDEARARIGAARSRMDGSARKLDVLAGGQIE
jgi:hypothetical protein